MSNEEPEYDLDFQDAKYNWDVVDKICIYSTKLLNKEDVESIEKINKLLSLKVFDKARKTETGLIEDFKKQARASAGNNSVIPLFRMQMRFWSQDRLILLKSGSIVMAIRFL